MSDGDEVADGQALAIQEARRLHAIKPDHELLRYLTQADRDDVWEDFMWRFGAPGLTREKRGSYPAMAYVYAMYFLALKEACEDPEKAIVVNHRPTEGRDFRQELRDSLRRSTKSPSGSDDDISF